MDYFKPYEGEEPYIFISYAHADSETVMKVVGDMHGRGYRIWYDEGIEVGSEWPECIAEHLYGAHLVIAFISNAYMRSDNCRREIHYSLSKKKKIINVFLENTEMTPGMEMQIGNIFALMKFGMSDEVFYQKLYSAPLLNSEAFAGANAEPAARRKASPVDRGKDELERRREELSLRKEALAVERAEARAKRRRSRKKRFVVFLLLFVLLLAAGITFGIIGYSTGYAERLMTKTVSVSLLPGSTTAEFSEPLFEQIARDFTGKAQGAISVSELDGITALHIVGDRYFFDGDELPENIEAVAEGSIKNLSDLQYFTKLNLLHISGQPLSTLGTLPDCNIEELHITDCKLTTLAGISNLPKLRVLVTDGCPISDLGDINRCLKLKKLSLIDSVISDYAALKPLVKLADFTTSNCDLDELYTVRHISSLTSLGLYDCDLRGRFFKAFDRERSIVSLRLVDCELDSTINIEDFSGLTELYLSGTGENLDWSLLNLLPTIKTVYVDADMESAMTRAIKGTGAEVVVIKAK